MKRKRQRLTPTQWVLIQHSIGQAAGLALSLVDGFQIASLIFSLGLTIVTVSRLVSRRSLGVIVARSIEPLLIIVVSVGWLTLMQDIIELDPFVRSIILTITLLWQARFLLLQFDPEITPPQSGHSLALIILMQTVAALWLIETPERLGIILFLIWVAQYCAAHFWLERIGFHNSFVAGAWALVASELVLFSSFTLIIYQLPLTPLLISRVSLATAGIAYAWGSLLKLHGQRQLTKQLVLEYGLLCALAFGLLYLMPAL